MALLVPALKLAPTNGVNSIENRTILQLQEAHACIGASYPTAKTLAMTTRSISTASSTIKLVHSSASLCRAVPDK